MKKIKFIFAIFYVSSSVLCMEPINEETLKKEAKKVLCETNVATIIGATTIQGVKKAKRKLLLKWHPDKIAQSLGKKFDDPSLQDLLKITNAAYKQINNAIDYFLDRYENNNLAAKFTAFRDEGIDGNAEGFKALGFDSDCTGKPFKSIPPNQPALDLSKEALARAQQLINYARKETNIKSAIPLYNRAIEELIKYLPDNGSTLMETYIEILLRYDKDLPLDNNYFQTAKDAEIVTTKLAPNQAKIPNFNKLLMELEFFINLGSANKVLVDATKQSPNLKEAEFRKAIIMLENASIKRPVYYSIERLDEKMLFAYAKLIDSQKSNPKYAMELVQKALREMSTTYYHSDTRSSSYKFFEQTVQDVTELAAQEKYRRDKITTLISDTKKRLVNLKDLPIDSIIVLYEGVLGDLKDYLPETAALLLETYTIVLMKFNTEQLLNNPQYSQFAREAREQLKDLTKLKAQIPNFDDLAGSLELYLAIQAANDEITHTAKVPTSREKSSRYSFALAGLMNIKKPMLKGDRIILNNVIMKLYQLLVETHKTEPDILDETVQKALNFIAIRKDDIDTASIEYRTLIKTIKDAQVVNLPEKPVTNSLKEALENLALMLLNLEAKLP
ncbi:hypothetical protein HYX58_05365 [Candidatus Dependentiae bacterium]|nr:hypothetical protein [Candidatus Dependentiae bacterium]